MTERRLLGAAARRRLAGGAVCLLGAVVTVAQLRPLPGVRSPVALLLTVAVPALFGAILVGTGIATARGALVTDPDAVRFAGWIVTGTLVFLLTGLWVLVLDLALGVPIPYGITITLDAVSLGGVVGAVIGLYDARSREQTRRLERRNERLDAFASMVSHDLRNPLEVATVRVAAARREGAEDGADEHLDIAARMLDRMEALIDDLLVLAREGGRVDPEPVGLADVAEASFGAVETGSATLVTETDGRIRADEAKLRELLENLVRNAVEHGAPDATITVGDLPDGFYVEDDGAGIPPEEREAVFESGYSTSPDGTGFGLHIVRRFAEAHGWEVRATDGPDGGARFEFTGVERPGD
ncbi:MAG: sensor histidine kinase [Haloferacaceae archaeon]